ncbi:MAG TPA: HD domain-containing phosphohydrolase [Marinobacterium sp.]|nr:HD domain-containing phosphohydrolase [Marinobacterium sp.]
MANRSGKHKLSPTQISLGVPTQWALYDSDGNLLLREGATVEGDHQIESLIRRGAYYYTGPALTEYKPPDPVSSQASSYEMVNGLLNQLETAHQGLVSAVSSPLTLGLLQSLIKRIQAVCKANPDAILGTTQLIIHAPSSLIHALHCSLICEIAGARLGWPESDRIPLIGAALTQNIGLFALQSVLDNQKTPLTPEQQKQIEEHPKRSAELLVKVGLRDRRWLQIVLQHHERLDGSGYPRQLTADRIIPETRLLAIIDSYVAMTRPRIYRQTMRSQEAMKELFKHRGQAIDGRMSELFLRAMGLFAPGCLVRRSTGEVAIILAAGPTPDRVIISSITDKQSRSLESPAPPEEINTTDISGVLNLTDHEKLVAHLGQIWPDPQMAGTLDT